MSANRYKQKVPTLFLDEERFEIEPANGEAERLQLEAKFAQLRDSLLEGLLEETQTLVLRKRFQQAAGEAAGLAWTTEFPLLVFPALFEEFTSLARKQEGRQQRIKARSAMLMAGAV
jgi:hypothetical protein